MSMSVYTKCDLIDLYEISSIFEKAVDGNIFHTV